jgi:putative ABC transport system permease protein
VLRNLKNTWRNLKKQRVTGIINISGLAIGIASAVLIFLWVQNELRYDNYHAGKDRIYRVKTYITISEGKTWVWETSPLLLAEEISKQVPDVEDATKIYPVTYMPMNLSVDNRQFSEPACAYVDERWFGFFQYTFLQGNAAAFNQHPFSLVITKSKASKFFGNENAVGKTIRIDTTDYVVQGVISDNPLNSSFQFDVLIPVAAKLTNLKELESERDWGNFNYLTFLRLKPGARLQAVNDKTGQIIRSHPNQDKVKTSLLPLAELHFENDLQSSNLQRGDRKTVYVFSVLGILILLVACINYVNLTTARASMRLKEVSIKKIVGADRIRLFGQFIGESAVTSLLSLIIGLALIIFFLPVFNRLTEKEFILDPSSPMIWYILGGTLLTSIVLTSIYPAILLSSFKPVQIFRGRGFLQVKNSILRQGLVVLQFTFSIALIIGVLVVKTQLNYIQKQDNGYNRSQVMSFTVSWKVQSKYDDAKWISMMESLKQSLLAQSSIQNVSAINQNSIVDMKGLSSGGADWEGRNPEFDPAISYFSVDDDFIKIVSMDIISGKWFEPGKNNDVRNVIVNETAVKELGLRQPVIGQRFKARGDSGVIIGMVKDFHFRSMHDKIGPMVIKKTNKSYSAFLVKSNEAQITKAAKAAEDVWKQFFPAEPFQYSFVDEEFDKVYKADQKASSLMSLFAGIAIIISCLGLFGLAAFAAERRTKEIGIRKVLGASVPGIVHLLTREFIILIITALLLASPVAWYAMDRWLQDFAYRIDISWWIFAVTGMVSLLIALLTVSFQAIRAAVSNPVKSLRTE